MRWLVGITDLMEFEQIPGNGEGHGEADVLQSIGS